jgi:hypothetical protein
MNMACTISLFGSLPHTRSNWGLDKRIGHRPSPRASLLGLEDEPGLSGTLRQKASGKCAGHCVQGALLLSCTQKTLEV